jgi:hypothetical protein
MWGIKVFFVYTLRHVNCSRCGIRVEQMPWVKGKHRVINEGIARMTNREDDCTGRFWEGRFSSQALLDEKALAACSAYVDLNSIRAGIANSLIDSDHTSIKRRCEQAEKAEQPNDLRQQAEGLHAFAGNPRRDMPNGLPFRLTDYLEPVDWTGRILRVY